MTLTNKQKRYLRKFADKKSAEQIALDLRIPIEQVPDELYTKNKQESTGADLRQRVLDFNFWEWFNKNKLNIFLLISLVSVVYFNALDNAFVSDDIPAILQNQNLGKFSSVLASPLGFIRPLLYYLTNNLFGLTPLPYRLIGIFFHLGTVLTAYLLIYLLLGQTAALISSALFAVHPILTEAVTWISGSVHSQYAFFIILGILFYLFSLRSKKFYWLSLLGFLLALFSSEKAMVFPFLLLALFLAYRKTLGDWKKLILPFLIGGAWVWLYSLAIPARLTTLQTGYYNTPAMLNPLWQIPIAISSYLQLIIWPQDLTLYHSEMVFSQTEYFLRLGVLVAFLSLILLTWLKKKPVFFWLSLFIISLLPTLTPFGISWIVAERYAYLGTLGIIVGFACLLKGLLARRGFKTPVLIFCLVLVAALSARTVVRNMDWQNQDNLWLAAAKTSPSSPQNHNNLGDLYARQGNLEKAVQEFKKAIELNSNYGDAYHNLANTYQQMGKIDLAIENYQKALEFNPNLWQSYQNLAFLYFQEQDFEKAVQNLEKALAINPQNAVLHLNLGAIYQKLGLKEKAGQEIQQALELDPSLKDNLSP